MYIIGLNMSKGFNKLVKIMERLRGPKGCPWDKEQTRESLKPFLIEEAYEVLESLDEEDPKKIREELGDLLFQILFHTQIAKERGEFDIDEVISDSIKKMIERHPHVFAKDSVKNTQEVLINWEEMKRKEKKGGSILEGVPSRLPALLRAHRLQDRAARVGFDWEHVDQVFEKVEEEMAEFKEAFKEKKRKRMEEELGDLLFALVNIARFLEMNPEDALRKAISRFISRFGYIEESIIKQGRSMKGVAMDEMERLWQEAKKKEYKNG